MRGAWADLDPLIAAADAAAAEAAFRRILGSVGVTTFTYLGLNLGPGRPAPVVTSTMPQDWLDRYISRHYLSLDPVILQARRSMVPFTWSAIRDRAALSAAQRRFMDEARSFGIAAGLAVPIHGPHGQFGLVSMVAERDGDLAPVEQGLLQAAALHYHVRRAADAPLREPVPGVALTGREAECLSWAAQGKSTWEIGRILGISRHTVQEHMTNAKRKLGCHSREHAVVKAVTLGLITP